MPVTPIRVLWLKDNRPGHVNKAKGFLAALAQHVLLDITPRDVRWRFSWLRHLVGRMSGTRFTPPPCWVLRDFSRQGGFDLIVSSGGLTQWPNAWLAQRLGVPNVYIGSPHHFSPAAFTLIPMTDPPHENPPFLKLTLVLSEVSPVAAGKCAREHFPVLDETGWTLLIGGDGEGLNWSDEDFLRLADLFMAQAVEAGKKVFVATSRRTPERVEQALRERFEGRDILLTGAWFHASGGKTLPLLALLGAADRIVVTADSVSMTNEAVAAGVPAVAVYPTGGAPNPRHEAQFRQLERDGTLARFYLAGADCLSAIQPPGGWRLVAGDPHADVAVRALRRLGFLMD
ncbi:MAG: ELM1/GtrOC1 family putative glycosyltransferase [Verrucomicrobia bacterium]|nr:ELM1/GtrOC1 family putative glycosyltransferase [Verrucomicrobiota bacterium]